MSDVLDNPMGTDGFEFVVAEQNGKRALMIRDGQHEYTFTEAGV